MVLVTSLDNWDRWTKEDQKLIDVDNNCGLSSNSDITVWSYDFEPIALQRYWFGNKKETGFLYNYCFPGPTPFYSYLNKYPNNFVYAIKKSIDAFMYLYRAGRQVESENTQQQEEPKVNQFKPRSIEELTELSRIVSTKDSHSFGKTIRNEHEVKLL